MLLPAGCVCVVSAWACLPVLLPHPTANTAATEIDRPLSRSRDRGKGGEGNYTQIVELPVDLHDAVRVRTGVDNAVLSKRVMMRRDSLSQPMRRSTILRR